jgi:hypothetical protein
MSDRRQMYRYVSDSAIHRHLLLKVVDDRTTTLQVPLSLRVSGIAKLKSSVCNPSEIAPGHSGILLVHLA